MWLRNRSGVSVRGTKKRKKERKKVERERENRKMNINVTEQCIGKYVKRGVRMKCK